MFKEIKRLPLTLKLLLICLIPISLSIYFSALIYKEKTKRIHLIESSLNLIQESSNFQDLVVALSWERRYSFNFIQRKERLEKLTDQKKITDSIIDFIRKTKPSLENFTDYTFLNELEEVRNSVLHDSTYTVRKAITFYTDIINRINLMDTPLPLGDFFQDVNFQNLHSQNNISKILNLLGTIRTQIYIDLYTQGYISRRSVASAIYYRLYESYDKELRANAPDQTIARYDSVTAIPSYARMSSTLTKIFSEPFIADSSYHADEWWAVSSDALLQLRILQKNLYDESENRLNKLYKREQASRQKTLIFVVTSILLVLLIIFYFASEIIRSLRKLETASSQIAVGKTGIALDGVPSGLLGNLAQSIIEIERNNMALTATANEIGKGNFDVPVTPRSDDDLLGLSIEKMRTDLKEFNSQKDQIQKETMQLVRNRDEFFSMTSHELKTPVTSLKAYTQLLLMDDYSFDTEQGKMILEKMDNQINKLVTLINDLLDTSRLQYGAMEYSKEPLKLNLLVKEVISEMQLSNPEYRLIFQKNVQATVMGNVDRLRQVINNLIGNAIKYSPKIKDIIIRLDKTEENVIFSIKDFGYGIKKEDAPFIFDRFFRVSEDNLNTYPGLGVGLYISSEFIKKHGGRMWVESEYQKGSTFYFELPLMD